MKKKNPPLEPMKVIKVGEHLPFNEMAEKQNISLYHLTQSK